MAIGSVSVKIRAGQIDRRHRRHGPPGRRRHRHDGADPEHHFRSHRVIHKDRVKALRRRISRAAQHREQERQAAGQRPNQVRSAGDRVGDRPVQLSNLMPSPKQDGDHDHRNDPRQGPAGPFEEHAGRLADGARSRQRRQRGSDQHARADQAGTVSRRADVLRGRIHQPMSRHFDEIERRPDNHQQQQRNQRHHCFEQIDIETAAIRRQLRPRRSTVRRHVPALPPTG